MPFLKCFWTKGESTATGSSASTMTAIWMASGDSWPGVDLRGQPDRPLLLLHQLDHDVLQRHHVLVGR